MVSTAPSRLESAGSPFRFDWAELAGAVGDLGVLVPIAVALIVKNGLTPTAVLLPAGLLYVVAGFVYRLPVPVQPLKAFGAIAIAHGFGADDVAEIVLSAPPLIRRLVGRPPVANPDASYARLCAAYLIAKVLQHGEITIAQFAEAARADPRTLALAALVRVVDDANPDPNALAPQSVSVRLTDGTTLTWRCDTMLAHPSRPLSSEEYLKKFRRCLEFAATALRADAAGQLQEQIDALERVEDVRALAGLAAGLPA